MISGTRALKITEIEAFADYMEMSVGDILTRFSANDASKSPRYDGLGNDEREVMELYRGLSEPGKQKFQALAEVVKKDEDSTPSNSN